MKWLISVYMELHLHAFQKFIGFCFIKKGDTVLIHYGINHCGILCKISATFTRNCSPGLTVCCFIKNGDTVLIYCEINLCALLFNISTTFTRNRSPLSSLFDISKATILYFTVVRKCLVNWLNYREAWVDLRVAQVVEALCYNAESRGFDSPWCRWDLSLN